MGEAKRRAAMAARAVEVHPCLHCTLWRAINAHAAGRGISVAHVLDAFAEIIGDLVREAPSAQDKRNAIAVFAVALNKHVAGMEASLGAGVTRGLN